MRIDPKTGELWTMTDSTKTEREVLVLRSTADGYVTYLLAHGGQKGACNVDFMGRTGTVYVDPRKIVFTHTANLEEKIRAIPDSKMDKVRSIIRQHLLLPAAEETDDLKARLSAAERSVIGMSERIKELTAQRDAYKDAMDRLIDKLPGQVAPAEPEPPKEPDKPAMPKVGSPEYREMKKRENMARLLPKQAYIGVKIDRYKMSYAMAGRLLDVAGNTVTAWANGVYRADWKKLDRIFPGIEKEAEEWAKNQEEKK